VKTQYKNYLPLLLIIFLCSCINKKESEKDKAAENETNTESNTAAGEDSNNLISTVNEKIKNIEIAKMIAEGGEFFSNGEIFSLRGVRGAIAYHNNDTLIIYDEISRESKNFLTDHGVYLIKLKETPGWFYATSSDYEIQGYVYIFDISERSFYGDLNKDGKNGPFSVRSLKIENDIIKQHQEIKRYGPLLLINHDGKNIEILDTFNGIGGKKHLLIDYYPEYNEILVYEQYYEGGNYSIYNLEHEEYRCERIEKPYFNNSRTALLSLVYLDDLGPSNAYTLKVLKINNGFYENIYNWLVNIDDNWSLRNVLWINDQKARIDYGEAGNVLIEIGDEVKVTNNLIPLSSGN